MRSAAERIGYQSIRSHRLEILWPLGLNLSQTFQPQNTFTVSLIIHVHP